MSATGVARISATSEHDVSDAVRRQQVYWSYAEGKISAADLSLQVRALRDEFPSEHTWKFRTAGAVFRVLGCALGGDFIYRR